MQLKIFSSFFDQKLQFTYSLGQPSALKREHSVFQKRKFIYFFSIFVGHFSLLDPDLDCENLDPDTDPRDTT
jgi:hypothetical protein